MRNIIIFCGFLATLSLVYVSNSIASSVSAGGGALPTCTDNGFVLAYSTATGLYTCQSVASSSGGDVVGPASATDNGVVIYDGTTGKLVQSSNRLTFDGSTLSATSPGGGIGGDAPIYGTSADAAVADWQFTARGAPLGYGAGMAMVSETSDGGTSVPMAKIVADGDSAWNTTGSTQDARVSIWTAVNGTLTEWLRLVSSGAHKLIGVSLNLDAGAAGTFAINNNEADGAVKVAGGNAGGNGGEFVGFGQSHASSANDFALRASDTNILYWDNSANTIEVGKAGTNFRLTNGAAGTGLIALSNNDGLLHITPHTSSGSGPNFRMFGGNHATLAQDIELSTNAANIFYYDHSANTLALGRTSTVVSVPAGATIGGVGIAPLTSPTFATSTRHSYATASTVPYFDASKDLISSAVTPTELGYVSGVTSAIQTQMNLKAPSASPTLTGTVTVPASLVGLVEVFTGHLEAPTAKAFVLDLSAAYAYTVNTIISHCDSGTADFDLEINGTNVTGCASQQMASSEATDTCTAANSVAIGDTLQINVTGVSSPDDCRFTVKVTR